MNFDLDTTEKIISVVVGVVTLVGYLFLRGRSQAGKAANEKHENINTNNVTFNVGQPTPLDLNVKQFTAMSVSELKRQVRVLFIDDDKGFQIVRVLKKMGWEHARIIADVTSLEQSALSEATVVFVDIQGVGKAMQYADEGLGLVLAIKRRYPDKKVVIYSAQEEGGWFHEALKAADYSLPKTAEPIRFEETIVRVCSS